MAEESAVGTLNFLASSEARLRILERLTEGPTPLADLQSDLDMPQSTLARNLGRLREEGWVVEVAESQDVLRLTALARAAVDEFAPHGDRVSVLARLLPYPEAFPVGSFDFDVGRLASAEWRTASETEPYAVVTRVRTVLEGSERVHSVRPHTSPAYADVLQRLADAGSEVVSVVPRARLDEDADASPGEDAVDLRTHDSDVDYALLVVDDERVLLTGDHAKGMPSVLVESTDEAVLDWARDRLSAVLEASEPVGDAQ